MAKKILVIDDDRLVVRSLARLLIIEGYDVKYAESGQQALNLIKNTDFDLIISDIKMPDIDGIETIERIRHSLSKTGRREPSVIFITGYPNALSVENDKEVNTVNFIYKPFDKNNFLESVVESLKNE